MSNVLGNNLKITVFGESHGPCIGITIDGISAGVKVDDTFIKECLSKRRPSTSYETKRVEQDNYSIVSGVFEGYTTGTPLTIIIPNENTKSSDYSELKISPRPGHADYVANVKYAGYQDYRGGGHFSGRITAGIVAGGAIVLDALEKIGVKIGSHIVSVKDVKDRKFSNPSEIDVINKKEFPVFDNQEAIENVMKEAAEEGDSVGGVIETMIAGLPVGVGSPMFDSLEASISYAMFAIGGIKGVEFGEGFNFANLKGSEANDAFEIDNKKIVTKTNHNGGVNGGISNGMPVTFNVVVKPTPSISKEQDTVNMLANKNEKLVIKGRHDPAIIRRVNIVIRCMTAFVVADALIARYGEDVLRIGF
ncbi:MAG: chorismate synthase [Bacilli bacterium]|nr:chorismate synthase [Bacilli bacterium]